MRHRFSLPAARPPWPSGAGQHQVTHELQHQGRFPATCFGDRQQMALQQSRWQHHLDAVPLMLRCTDPESLAAGLESITMADHRDTSR